MRISLFLWLYCQIQLLRFFIFFNFPISHPLRFNFPFKKLPKIVKFPSSHVNEASHGESTRMKKAVGDFNQAGRWSDRSDIGNCIELCEINPFHSHTSCSKSILLIIEWRLLGLVLEMLRYAWKIAWKLFTVWFKFHVDVDNNFPARYKLSDSQRDWLK